MARSKQANREGDKPIQLKDGRWRTRISFVKPDGTRGRKAIYGQTQRECIQKKQAILADQVAGKPVRSDERQLVGPYLTDWLETVKRLVVRPKTYASYKQIVTAYLVPALGHHRLVSLDELDIQRFLNKLRTQKVQRSRTGECLSARTVHYAYAVLKDALQKALDWGLVKRNAAEKVDSPGKGRPQVRFLTPSQAHRFLDSVRGDRHEALYVLAVMCGLRIGEITGLTWDCIDFDARTLKIKAAMQRVARTPTQDRPASTELNWVEPKTECSKRTIALAQTVLQSLHAHRARQAELILLFPSERWEDRNLVFCTVPHPTQGHPGGRPLDSGNLTKAFRRVLEAAGLPRIGFHDLRHTCASLLLSQGVHLKVVQELLGHADFNLTAQTYSHVIQELKRAAADSMDHWHREYLPGA